MSPVHKRPRLSFLGHNHAQNPDAMALNHNGQAVAAPIVNADSHPFENFPPELTERILFELGSRSRYNVRSQNRDLKQVTDGSWRDLQFLSILFESVKEPRHSEVFGNASLDDSVDIDSDSPQTSGSSSDEQQNGPSTSTQPHHQPVLRRRLHRFMELKCVKSKPKCQPSPFGASAVAELITSNPYTGGRLSSIEHINANKVDSFLRWVGAKVPKLHITMSACHLSSRPAASAAVILRPVKSVADLETGSYVTELQLRTCFLLTDRRFLLRLIDLARNRQDALIQDDIPFVQSLFLGTERGCEKHSDRSYHLEQQQHVHLMMAEHQAWLQLHGLPHGHAGEDDEFLEYVQHLQQQQSSASGSRSGSGRNRIALEDMKNLLQRLLDACEGLQELELDELLWGLSLSDFRYPKSLTNLKTDKLASADIGRIINNCPLLQMIKLDCSNYTHFSQQDCSPLAKLSGLRELAIHSLNTPSAVAEQIFGTNPHIMPPPNPWPNLTKLTLVGCKLNTVFLLQFTRSCPQLQYVFVSGRDELFVQLTEQGVSLLCELPELRHLELKWQRNDLFGDIALDTLSDHCPHLRTLKVDRCKVGPLSMPRLLRQCPKLEVVQLELVLRLSTLDSLVMIRCMGTDVADRVTLTHIQITAVESSSYESVARILDGLAHSCEMVMSNLSDFCLHDLERCDRCLFDAETRAGRRRVLVLGHRQNRQSAVVFSCKVSHVQQV